jgi:hypothetical protein
MLFPTTAGGFSGPERRVAGSAPAVATPRFSLPGGGVGVGNQSGNPACFLPVKLAGGFAAPGRFFGWDRND